MTEAALERLDDPAALTAADPSEMLRAVASGAAQVRASWTAAREASLDPIAPDERPRAVVVAGMGGSGISGDVLAAVAGAGSPVPIVVHRGYGLPGWVGAADLVMAVSCSGTTAETLSGAAEAARRGTRLLGVGTADSPLDAHCRSTGGGFIPIVKQLSPRSSLWALATPLLVVAARLGIADIGPDDADLESAAARLEAIAEACRLDRESFVNPAKQLATELSGSLPMFWGAGQVGPVAALRAACQLEENAKLPALSGALPEAHHNQVVAFDGALAGGEADFFRDRVDEPEPLRLRLVVVRDDTDDVASHRADVSATLAEDRGIAVSTLRAEGDSAVERLASLVGVIDFASVYLGLMHGIDPTPIAAIDALKRAL
ncbi:MAG TPA: SIS domain-containing protein [Mycobacteriales bacterium]|nr:SIS domain-containing protein [Mycobacteriales bacterium]